jgi:hypothetical protein
MNIKLVTKEEFIKILVDHWLESNKYYDMREIAESLIESGFPKIDFENLSKCLPQLCVYLPTMAVDFGDRKYVWVVSGNKAILVDREKE